MTDDQKLARVLLADLDDVEVLAVRFGADARPYPPTDGVDLEVVWRGLRFDVEPVPDGWVVRCHRDDQALRVRPIVPPFTAAPGRLGAAFRSQLESLEADSIHDSITREDPHR